MNGREDGRAVGGEVWREFNWAGENLCYSFVVKSFEDEFSGLGGIDKGSNNFYNITSVIVGQVDSLIF